MKYLMGPMLLRFVVSILPRGMIFLFLENVVREQSLYLRNLISRQ